ncbi:MAG: glycosyltransferase family 2 protein [Candidatus Eisenbacteria bacterium]
MDLSVVVVTYRSREHVIAGLRSLEAGLRAPAGATPLTWECVVVDNDSHDGTPELVARETPWARLVQTGANLGYAKAVNRGIAETTGEFVLVLNPDCVWAAGGIHALVSWQREHARCAIAAPRILNSDGTLEYSARSYPSPFAFLFNRYSLLTRLWPGNPWTRRYLLSDWDHTTPRSVDWVSGAAMLVRRAAAAEVGGMDEVFFMFNEDVDWCRRMNLAGWTVDYVAAAEVVHHIGASKGEVSNRVILERHRGMIHYFRKHHPAPGPLDALAAFVIMTRARLLVFLNGRSR